MIKEHYTTAHALADADHADGLALLRQEHDSTIKADGTVIVTGPRALRLRTGQAGGWTMA